MIVHLDGQLRDQAAALCGRQPAPGTVEGGAGGHDRSIDVGRVAASDPGKLLARCGIELGEGFSRLASDIAAIDEMSIHVLSDRSGRA